MNTKVTSINKNTIKGIRETIDLGLEPIRNLTGLHLKLGTISYDSTGFTVKLTGSTQNEDGTFETPERVAFKKGAWILGLKDTDLDKEFTHFNGVKYTIAGLKPRSKMYPVLCKRASDDKMFKFPSETIKHLIKK